jgi:hypothetical protein
MPNFAGEIGFMKLKQISTDRWNKDNTPLVRHPFADITEYRPELLSRVSGVMKIRESWPVLNAPVHAREKSLNFFAFRQQQMGNWPINCCDALGLPISAPSF